MKILDILEKIVSIICPIISIVLSIIALCKSNYAVKQINKIKVGDINKKQEANNNIGSNITQNWGKED